MQRTGEPLDVTNAVAAPKSRGAFAPDKGRFSAREVVGVVLLWFTVAGALGAVLVQVL